MNEKERMEEVLRAFDTEKMSEAIKGRDASGNHFEEKYTEIVEKHAGKIVAVSAVGKIVAVPFTSDVAEAKKNFKVLEQEIGEENMHAATISYIPDPKQILFL